MKTYTFTINNNTKSNNNKGTNYSKILDNLIHASIAEKNPYLFNSTTTSGDIYLDKMIDSDNNTKFTFIGLKDADAFTKAANFLASYGTKNAPNHTNSYEYGKTYYLNDGTPIIFFDDSIQIGFDLYYFDDFKKPFFLNGLTPTTKKTIIDIYTNGLKISIIK